MKPIKKILIISVIVGSLTAADDFPTIPGWKASSEIRYYTAENLWEYINGAADQFIDYDMQDLKVREFKTDSLAISIDIYDMRDPLSAFGIYALESRTIEPKLSIGAEAAITPPSLALMVKDRYYIKVYAFEGELTQKAGERVLHAIADVLTGDNGLPKILTLLPVEHQIEGSIGFTRKSYQGLAELNNCIFADYQMDKKNIFQYFVLIPAQGETVEQTIEKISQKWQKMVMNSSTVLFRKIPYQGFIGLIISNETIFGVSGVQEKDELLKYLTFILQ